MARYHVAPTKTNLLKVRRDQSFALEGHRLLEQKRDILVAELMAVAVRAAAAEKNLDDALRAAYEALGESVMRLGRVKVKAAAQAVNLSAGIAVRQRDVIGVHLPVIEETSAAAGVSYGLLETGIWIDEAAAAFQRVVKLLGPMAEIKITLLRLAAEVRKTVRRVNALEQIYLPDYADTMKYINDVLEEQSREAFFVLKMIKTRFQHRQSAASPASGC
ncbi:MAG: V-type ATP synthase subunit D [Candidatus Omnitrophota bacterium]